MIRRRVLAALLLLGFAVGSSLFWAGGRIDPSSMAANLALAAIGLILLHFRWRKRERRVVTPEKGRKTFS